MWGISQWFCCLALQESVVLVATLSYFAYSAESPLSYDHWKGFWLGLPFAGEARQRAFLSIYGLTIVPISIDPELPPVDCVEPVDLALWGVWEFWFLSNPFPCPSGCEQSRVP